MIISQATIVTVTPELRLLLKTARDSASRTWTGSGGSEGERLGLPDHPAVVMLNIREEGVVDG